MIKKTTDILISIFNLNHFENSIVFLLFLILPLLYFLNKFYQKRGYKFIFYSSRKFFKREESTKVILIKSIYGIKLIALFFFIIAMARPQRVDSYKVEKIAGLNIMITLDISGSMKALDFHPKNRLEAAKEVIIDFIKKRTNDKLGLVVFAGTAYTKSPLTINYDFLRQYVLETSTEDLKEEGGTAIGVALATAVNRLVGVISNNKSINKSNLLKNNKKKNARGIIILLTDGINNTGEIDPNDAADMAKDFNIKVYTIGIGKTGKVPYVAIDQFGNKRQVMIDSEIDEKLLKRIAKKTGGLYFNATKKKSLVKIFEDINKWEKTEISRRTIKDVKEKYYAFLIFGILLLFIAEVLKRSILRTIP